MRLWTGALHSEVYLGSAGQLGQGDAVHVGIYHRLAASPEPDDRAEVDGRAEVRTTARALEPLAGNRSRGSLSGTRRDIFGGTAQHIASTLSAHALEELGGHKVAHYLLEVRVLRSRKRT